MLPLLVTLALVVGGGPAVHVAYADPYAPPQPNLKPPTITYCQPLAAVHYNLIIGIVAYVRPSPGCTRGSLIRRVSDQSGQAGDQQFVPLPSGYDYMLTLIYLFRSHLEFTLDGQQWNALKVYR